MFSDKFVFSMDFVHIWALNMPILKSLSKAWFTSFSRRVGSRVDPKTKPREESTRKKLSKAPRAEKDAARPVPNSRGQRGA